ncbi:MULTISPECIES: hypothetical protein [Rhodanobacter]|uniref:Lipoprotein n=1 Tax=Rhodanobacter denitrificans TaxID=666685 RepID=M4NIP0_9GAMM|nr:MULTISPECIES: hypothetical protein [Rhodanobacter]AGG90815.1 hypothetical protein R2APBS1_3756 [Rhodanobacter denitrificans]KZC20828.1 hypothetical protein RHOFW104R3_23535 [Rhodanobacter denitrificans]UJJ50898.1 hypothetical protein LRK52_16935 [Rhodanobacter denitrificans]UJJ56905.1 hypothetical protein LRK55_09450 [Rhodanobacter denitrificans]UJM86187.1 hypothetical protein LRJ86_15585 [Rhodanobacter denitrificans]
MSRSRLLLLLLLPMLLLTMAFRQTPLVDPPPIDVPAGLTAVQVSKAVKGALIGRTWVVTAEHADGIDAALNGNDYQAKIHVAFDTHQVRIRYVDSTNLKYKVKKDGTRLIHTNYMNWMRYLSGDIGRDLQLISAGAESMPMASPGG